MKSTLISILSTNPYNPKLRHGMTIQTTMRRNKKAKHKIVSKKKRGSGAVALSFLHIHGVLSLLVSGSLTNSSSPDIKWCVPVFDSRGVPYSQPWDLLWIWLYWSGSNTLSEFVSLDHGCSDERLAEWIGRKPQLFRWSIVFKGIPSSPGVIAWYTRPQQTNIRSKRMHLWA